MSCKGLLKISIIYQEYELKRVPYKRELLIYTYSKNHRIPCCYSGDVAKFVTVPKSRLENLSTSLLYFTGSEQNALSLC